MKQFRLILQGTLLASAMMAQLLSCSKHQEIRDNGCIDRIAPDPGQILLPAAQLDSIHYLFSKNNLPAANLQFNEYLVDNVQLPGVHRQIVTASLFFNGLPLFDFDNSYTFDNGALTNSWLYPGAPSSNDTSGHQILSFLRSAFIKYAIPASPDDYANTCVSATLGYLDNDIIPNKITAFGTPVKVWRITPSDATYPIVYVKDDDSSAWGIPINRLDP